MNQEGPNTGDHGIRGGIIFGGVTCVGVSLWMMFSPGPLKWSGALAAGSILLCLGVWVRKWV